MLLFNKSSWHYKLVQYVFGDLLFVENYDIDFDRSVKENKMIWKTKPKQVNLCPYLRAVSAGIIAAPFVWIKKRLPHKTKPVKQLSREEMRKRFEKRSKILRATCACVLFAVGIHNLILGQYLLTIFEFVVGIWIIFSSQIMTWIARHWPKRKRKQKEYKPKVHKNPSLFGVWLKAEHAKVCPPIYFADKSDVEKFR